MKTLGYLESCSAYLLQDEDGDLALSLDESGYDLIYFVFSSNEGSVDDFAAEVKALTEDPTTRLVAAVREAVEHYTDESAFEFDGDPLVAALAEFDAAVAERQ